MDFLDILDFVAYDLNAARELIKEHGKRVEKVQSEPVREIGGRLCCACCSCRARPDVGAVVFVVV